MGVISFGTLDSLQEENPFAESMIDQIKTSFEYDLYFSPEGSMTVNEVPEVTKRMIYDKPSRIIINTLEKGSEKWYCVDSVGIFMDSMMTPQMDSMFQSQEFQDSMKNIFRISQTQADQKIILGFPCVKVTIMDPNEPSEVTSISYCTDRIPISEVMGPLTKFMPGVALETTIFVNGTSILTGALDFTPLSFKEKYFGIELNQYKKLSSDEFQELAYNLMN